PASVPKDGIYIQPVLKGYTSFDFSKAKAMIDSGYVQTLRQMDELKSKITRRRSCEQVTASRNNFNNRNPVMLFDEIKFKGFNSKQRTYLRHLFHFDPNNPKPMYFNRIKKSYFKLVSEDYFNNAYPNILYDTSKNSFQFQLTRR